MTYIYDFFIGIFKKIILYLFASKFLALGVSTMLGDAFLHILPAVLGLHSHDEPADEGEEPVEEPDLYMEAIKKLSVVVGIIYFFWIFEQTMSMMGHGHSHGGATVAHDDEVMTKKTISDEKEKEKEDEASKSYKIAPAVESTDFGDAVEAEKKPDWREQRSAIIGILVGDCIHNFVDGLALGTTWAKGRK
jgi:zinc transporter ZupT